MTGGPPAQSLSETLVAQTINVVTSSGQSSDSNVQGSVTFADLARV